MTPPMNPHQKPQEDVVGLIAKLRAEADNPSYMAGDGYDWCQVDANFLREVADTLQRTYEAGRRDMREAAGKVAELATFGCEITETDDKGWPTTPAGAAKHTGLYIAQQIRNLPTEHLGGDD